MIVRALNPVTGDWTFGQGKNNYLSSVPAIQQSIKTRLSSFLGDCFFATDSGIDWFNLLGTKQILQLRLAIATTILNTPNVSGIIELLVTLDAVRELTVQYTVTTNFSDINLGTGTISETLNLLLTEGGDVITTEGGAGLTI